MADIDIHETVKTVLRARNQESAFAHMDWEALSASMEYRPGRQEHWALRAIEGAIDRAVNDWRAA